MILPGGETEAGESIEETANRELQEEIGYRAGKLEFLGEVQPFSKYLRVRSFLYVAQELTASKLEGDEDYIIDVEKIRLDDFEALIAKGKILDARVIAGLYLARSFMERDSK